MEAITRWITPGFAAVKRPCWVDDADYINSTIPSFLGGVVGINLLIFEGLSSKQDVENRVLAGWLLYSSLPVPFSLSFPLMCSVLGCPLARGNHSSSGNGKTFPDL